MKGVRQKLTLDQPATYQIKVPGEFTESWSDWAGGMTITVACEGGGNYIILLPYLDMVIVTTADPLYDLRDADPWKYEGAINRLVGRFMKSLPEE